MLRWHPTLRGMHPLYMACVPRTAWAIWVRHRLSDVGINRIRVL